MRPIPASPSFDRSERTLFSDESPYVKLDGDPISSNVSNLRLYLDGTIDRLYDDVGM